MPSTAKAWIVIVLADLYDYLVAAQVDAINTAALKAGQTDRFTKAIIDVQLTIRMKVESNPTNVVSATANSIPPELKWCACYLILDTLQTAIPGLDLEKDQRDQIERAWSTLNRVADGRDLVTIPVDPLSPSEVQKGAPAQLVSSSVRTVTQSSMRGI